MHQRNDKKWPLALSVFLSMNPSLTLHQHTKEPPVLSNACPVVTKHCLQPGILDQGAIPSSHNSSWLSLPPQPEGLSGSSQMKGGSTTKVLLETLLLAAHKTVDWGIAASQK